LGYAFSLKTVASVHHRDFYFVEAFCPYHRCDGTEPVGRVSVDELKEL
jgi:hypothetical protein